MLGSGALVVVAEGTDLLALAANVTRFFRNESCGKCVPVPRRLAEGGRDCWTRCSRRDAAGPALDVLPDLGETMALTSICGLGQVAVGPGLSVLKSGWRAVATMRVTHHHRRQPPGHRPSGHHRSGTRRNATGIDIPVLCHHPKMQPVGVCRMCVVDVGGRVLAASCVRPCEEGMNVETGIAQESRSSGKMLTALLLADHPIPCAKERTTGDDALDALGRRYGLLKRRRGMSTAEFFAQTLSTQHSARPVRPQDLRPPSSPSITRPASCCDRCIRACDDIQ